MLRQSCLHTALRASKQLVPLDTYLVRICAALAALSSDILLITRSTLAPLALQLSQTCGPAADVVTSRVKAPLKFAGCT